MALPTNIGSGIVKGLFLRGIGDTPDPDRVMDGVPIVGMRVYFEAQIRNEAGELTPYVRDVTSNPPATIFLDTVEAVTNGDGLLVPKEDPTQTGVPLIASNDIDLQPNGWTWRVTVEPPDRDPVFFDFMISDGDILDLGTIIPVPPDPGAELEDWAAAVQYTVTNGAVNGSGRLILTRTNGTTVDAGYVLGAKGDKGDQGDITLSYRTANVTGAQGIGPALARTFRWTLAGNTSVNSIGSANSTITGTITFIVYQAGAGNYTFSHPPEVTRWLGGAPAPILPTGVGNGMMFHYFWDGIGWYGVFAGNIYA